MNALSNIRIGARLAAGFTIILVLTVAVVAVGATRLSSVYSNLEKIAQVRHRNAMDLTAMRRNVLDEAIAVRNLVLLTCRGSNICDAEFARLQKDRKDYQDHLDALTPRVITEVGKQNLAAIEVERSATAPEVDRVADLAKRDDARGAVSALLKVVRPKQAAWMAAINKQVAREDDLMAGEVTDAADAYAQARMVLIACGVVAVVLGILIAFFLTISIVRPLQRAVGLAGAIAEGDLTRSVEVKGNDETARLLRAMRDMQANLVALISRIKESADSINVAAGQIAVGNADLSRRTEEQASSLEETASSMEELTSTVRQNADNARQADELGSGARDVAQKGGAVMEQVVATMGDIHESSTKIVEIISVIDGIAFQTNILALNAAVEAARAGEQGRGFAVVAGEVRNLAQRSAAAAKEIKSLIGDTVTKVDGGTKLVESAGATMENVVGSVRRVTDIIADIAAASREQSSGIEQVNKAVVQMDEVTQQNAALVEESTAAAGSLEEQAQGLVAAVSSFRIAAADAALPRTAAPLAVPSFAAQRPTAPSVHAPRSGRTPRPDRHAPLHRNGSSNGAVALVTPDDDADWKEF